METLTLTGNTNAAECALQVLKRLCEGQVAIDEASFAEVAKNVAPYFGPGFIVETWRDLDELCRLGDFCIRLNGDLLTCVPILGRMKV